MSAQPTVQSGATPHHPSSAPLSPAKASAPPQGQHASRRIDCAAAEPDGAHAAAPRRGDPALAE